MFLYLIYIYKCVIIFFRPLEKGNIVFQKERLIMPAQQLIMSVVLWIVVFGVFYFLLVRPQKKKDKELKQMRDSINVGDKVVTIGGLCATVAKVEEERVVLEVGPNRTKMPFEKWAIGTVTEKKEVKHEIADPAKEKEEN